MKGRRFLAPLLGVVCFFAVWEGAVRFFHIRKFILRAPSTALSHLWSFRGDYLSAAWVTSQHAVIGLLVALVMAIGLGALLSFSRFLDQASQPILILVQVTPWFAYSSSVVVWLGAGTPPVLFMVSLVCFPAFVFAAVDGMRNVEPATMELMRSVDASAWEILRRIRLPSAAPTLFTTARFNFGLSLAAAYYMETVNLSNEGLGRIGSRAAMSSTAADAMWAAVLTVALVGAVGLAAITWLNSVVLHWHAANRSARP